MHQAGLTEDPHRQIHKETRNVKAENVSEEVLIGVAISLGVHGKIKKTHFECFLFQKSSDFQGSTQDHSL